jgi:hypothetical protein
MGISVDNSISESKEELSVATVHRTSRSRLRERRRIDKTIGDRTGNHAAGSSPMADTLWRLPPRPLQTASPSGLDGGKASDILDLWPDGGETR